MSNFIVESCNFSVSSKFNLKLKVSLYCKRGRVENYRAKNGLKNLILSEFLCKFGHQKLYNYALHFSPQRVSIEILKFPSVFQPKYVVLTLIRAENHKF